MVQYLCRRQHDNSDQDNVDVGAQRMILIDLIHLEQIETELRSTQIPVIPELTWNLKGWFLAFI